LFSDFETYGISVSNRGSLIYTKTLRGTPIYLSPEKKKFYDIDPHSKIQGIDEFKSDVFSLGLSIL
jgi:hypothetical protein